MGWRLFCIDKSAPVTKTGRLCGGGLRESERLLPVVTQVEKGRRKKIVFKNFVELPLFWLLGPKVGRLIPFERSTRQIRPTNTRSELHNFDATARTERGAAQRAIYCPVLTMNPAADGWCRNWEAKCGTITRRDAGVEPTGTYPRRVPHLAVRFLPSLEPPPPQPNKPKNPPSSHFIQPTLINQKQSDSMNPNHQSSSRNPLSPKQKLAQK